MITYQTDQKSEAWGYFLRQHRNKTNLKGFVQSFYGPFSSLVSAHKNLRELRGVDTAAGVQLDGVGVIVGVGRVIPKAVALHFFGYSFQPGAKGYSQARYRKSNEAYADGFGLPDEDYRLLIKAKIIQNNAHGTVEEIISAATVLFNATLVQVVRSGTAALTITITRPSTGLDNAHTFFESFMPVAAGITTTYVYIDA